MSIYAVCFSVIKSCTYLDFSTLQALHEHACLFCEECNVDRVDKMPSNINVYDAEIKIKYSHLNIGVRAGGAGGRQPPPPPQSRKYSGKTPKIRAIKKR